MLIYTSRYPTSPLHTEKESKKEHSEKREGIIKKEEKELSQRQQILELQRRLEKQEFLLKKITENPINLCRTCTQLKKGKEELESQDDMAVFL